jgi:ABC-type uncharacterized transport system substrate-binding protein
MVACAILLGPVSSSQAQQLGKIPRIGLLSPFSPSATALWHEAFRQGLRDLGWVEGKNISIEYRYAEGRAERLPDLAADLVRLKVDIIVAAVNTDALAAKNATRARAGALAIMPDPLFAGNLKRIADLAAKSRLPSIFHLTEFVSSGGLVAYGVDRSDQFRRAATYVDKILKGAKPADLPVEQPTKFELIINLKTAKQIGLTIPPNVLARADKVIK